MADAFEKVDGFIARLMPRRIPLLYLILTVLLALSVVPLVLYGTRVSQRNREALMNKEREHQQSVTRGIAQEIRLYLRNMSTQTESLVRNLESTGAIKNVNDPKYAAALDDAIKNFLGVAENVRVVTVVHAQQSGRQAGVIEIASDEFVRRRMGDGFQSAP